MAAARQVKFGNHALIVIGGVERDPLYSQAYAGLAATYYLFPLFVGMGKDAPPLSRAEAYAKRTGRLKRTG